jgi:hypothetical protein
MKSATLSLMLTCLAVSIAVGCSKTAVDVAPAAAADFVNTRCPIMGNAVDTEDPTLVREWNGKKVGFCCPPCLEEWDELTDAEKTEKLAAPPKSDGATHKH